MKFVTPTVEELSYLRADPLLWEQELDVRPKVAESVERAVGKRAGRSYWRSVHDHLYALELADLGRGRPSMAMVYGMWDRYEPRPPEQEIDADLIDFSLWIAEISEGLDPVNLSRVLRHDWHEPSWPEGSVLRTPAERFSHLPDFPYEPRFVEMEGLRMAYVEAGRRPAHSDAARRADLGLSLSPNDPDSGRGRPCNRTGPDWLRTFRQTGQRQRLQLSLACALAATFHKTARSSANHTRLPGLGRPARVASVERDARPFFAPGGDEYRNTRRSRARRRFHAMAAIRATSAATRRRRHRAKCPENAHAQPTPKSTRIARPFPHPIIRRVRWLSRAWCRSAPIIPELTKIGSPSRVLSGSNCRYCCLGVTPIRCWENLSLS